MSIKNEAVLVANDNGYAAHKLAWLDESGVIKTGKITAAIETGHTITSTTGAKIDAYTVGDSQYTCTDNSSDLISLRHANYPLSPENRVLFTHAVNAFDLADKSIKASVTLPYRDYYNENGTINTDFVQKVGSNFKQNNVVIEGLGSVLSVESVQVTPEAISAWFDWAMNDDGKMNDNYDEMNEVDGSVLIIDIGGSTTDIVSVNMLKGELIVRNEKSNSTKLGVLDVTDELHAAVKVVLHEAGVEGMEGHASGISKRTLDRILATGKARMNGKQYDFTKQRDSACANTAQAIINYIRNCVGSTAEYFSIVFVGGGSVVFKPWMQKMLPSAEFSDEFANARGALKFLISQQG